MDHENNLNEPLILSVSGLRGIVGRSLTPAVVYRYATAFGQWVHSSRPEAASAAPLVVLGRDSRPSGRKFELAAAGGLETAGCRVTRLGVLSTPGVAVMVQHLRADGGLVVTASHNPSQWNGLKPLRHDGAAPPADQVQHIQKRFESVQDAWAAVGSSAATSLHDTSIRIHRDVIVSHLDVPAIRAAKLCVVVDHVHGAGGAETQALLSHLGVKLIHLYAEPTGHFPHNPEPMKQNLTELCDKVRTHQAHLGLAQDPDADRLAVIDERGQYIGEEYTLALCALHMLRAGDTIVANLSTSRMIDDIADRVGADVVRTSVGEAHVAAQMRSCGAPIGGEGNGGVIWAVVSHVRDSLVGMSLLLEMIAKGQKPLSEFVDQIPRYAIVKDKVAIHREFNERLGLVLRAKYASQNVDLRDGVRIDWPDRWVHVRPSNTEPILRLIGEAATPDQACALIREVKSALGLELTNPP